MANRKVLINRHTTGSTAPQADSMYLGEIAVAHETGKETLFTKNTAGVMVPFISCAQTISIVSGMIESVDVVYNVEKKAGEPYINVETSGTDHQKVFTLSTSGVASETNLNALSSATVNNFQRMTNILSALTDVVVIGISGDSIITATKVENGSGSNEYNLAHKTGLTADGFNKLATDGFGHVTAATPVAASDIKTLGFEDSAWTEQKITDAIEALDSAISASTTGRCLTAISIKDGKLDKIEDAGIPVLSVESAGTGNVVEAITVNGHKISYTTTSVATSHDIEELSAATVAEFTSAFTAIQGMDKAADAVAGQVVTTVSQEDGKVTETKANVKDLQLGGYSKDTAATGDIASADTINTALNKLENKANANAISNADGSINVTTGATGTDINVNIKTSDPILAKDGGNGVYSTLNLVKIETGLPTTVKERYELQGINGAKIGQDIDIPKDSHIISITYITNSADTHYQNLEYKYLDVDGNEQTAYVDMSSLVFEAEFKSGVTSTDGIVHGVVDSTSEKDSNNNSFLTVGADGFKVDGIKDEIDTKIAALDVTDTAAAGQYVSAVNEVDGKVSMTRANVSEAILNNYTKGTDATAVAATDSVNEAISKLENQVDKAKAAATTKVVEGTDEGNNMTIVSDTGLDSSVTYTVNLTDVASKTALTAEIAARKAVDGQNGDSYAANTGANYISDAGSLNDADVKLDAALKAEETARTNQDDVIEGAVGLNADGTHKTTTGNYTSAATTVVGEIAALDSALKSVADQVGDLDYTGLTNENTKVVTDVKQDDGLVSASATTVGDLVITAITTADTKVAANDSLATIAGKLQGQIDAMDSTAQTSGNGYFLTSVQLADGKITAATQSDKVNSASTADSADKVKNALSISGYATSNSAALDSAINYDGSAAQSITFGKDTAAGKSMSFNGGVVDVEIIDCGTY